MTTSTALPTDPRPFFATAVTTAVPTISAVRREQLDGPTPCAEFDVRRLLGHLVPLPPLHLEIPDDGWAAAAREAADDVLAVWSDDTLLDRELTLPYGRHRGAVALATYTGELSTHTWDLAAATGQSPAWDDAALAVALEATHRILPAGGRGGPIPFGPVVPVADDAPVIERLVAWQGRDPRWKRGL
jgi:uncharacterized protein (TIGR03086 family)